MAPEPTPEETRSQWHLEKRFSLSILALLLANMVGGVWYVSKMDSRVEALEKGFLNVTLQVAEDRTKLAGQRERAEARVDTLSGSINTISGDIRALTVQMTYLNQQVGRLVAISDAEKNRDGR